MSNPVIVIFTRHKKGCKYEGDEFCRRCNCKKWLRWTHNGKRYRVPTNARAWHEAEEVKRERLGQLMGHTTATPTPEQEGGKDLKDAVDLFITDKRVQGISEDVLGKYERELARLCVYLQGRGVYVVQRITRELLTGYAATWAKHYPSGNTRAAVRQRCRAFLRYCYETQWLARVPQLPKVKVEEVPTMPLTAEQYAALLGVVPKAVQDTEMQTRVHALFQLMRYSGLAIFDALTLPIAELTHDAKLDLYRIRTAREKTGTDVSVLLPPDVAAEVLAVHAKNPNPRFIFWSGEGEPGAIVKSYQKYYVAPCFKAAGLHGEGFMVSHRLRDTFAVGMLEGGASMESVSKALGHKSIKTTERHYAAWVITRQAQLDAQVMAAWVSKDRERERLAA